MTEKNASSTTELMALFDSGADVIVTPEKVRELILQGKDPNETDKRDWRPTDVAAGRIAMNLEHSTPVFEDSKAFKEQYVPAFLELVRLGGDIRNITEGTMGNSPIEYFYSAHQRLLVLALGEDKKESPYGTPYERLSYLQELLTQTKNAEKEFRQNVKETDPKTHGLRSTIQGHTGPSKSKDSNPHV